MGVSNNDGIKPASKGRGKTNVARSLDGLGTGKGAGGAGDYAAVTPNWLLGIIVEATRRGGAASFGLSRDKGAYNVTVFLDGERRTVWISTSEDVDAALEQIVHFLASLPD